MDVIQVSSIQRFTKCSDQNLIFKLQRAIEDIYINSVTIGAINSRICLKITSVQNTPKCIKIISTSFLSLSCFLVSFQKIEYSDI